MISNPIYTNISAKARADFKSTWLMIKRHNRLMYFCKTVGEDPYGYSGSGAHWTRHIKKHGKEHIETLWCERFDDIDLLVEFALFFSEVFDIVASTEWANLIPENGIYGGGVKGHAGRKWTDEDRIAFKPIMIAAMNNDVTRERCSVAKKGKPGHKHTDKSKLNLSQKHFEHQANLTDEERLHQRECKLSEKNGMFGKKWYNDGSSVEIFIPGQEPTGWILGRLQGFTHDKRFYTNGLISKAFIPGQEPEGWILGRGPFCRHVGGMAGKLMYNNGYIAKGFIPGQEPPDWVQGHLRSPKKWFTNGATNGMFKVGEEPEDWTLGQTRIGRKWFTDGINNGMYIPGQEPTDWILGRTIMR